MFFFVLAIILGIIALIALVGVSKEQGKMAVSSVLFVVAGVFLLISFARVIPAGTVGVYDLFGKVKDQEYHAGLRLVAPYVRLIKMSIKTEETQEMMNVPSKEGLNVVLDVSILTRLSPESASEIYKKVGKQYREIVLIPQFRSAARGVTVNYEAKALYTSGREEVAQQIIEALSPMLEERGLILEKVLLRSIELPKKVSEAIETKLKAEQESEQMKFVLTREMQEAERKIIEAHGIAKAQEIINRTLTAAYLQHEAIQTQLKMADSPNHTTVYIPCGDNGIPLVRVLENKQ